MTPIRVLIADDQPDVRAALGDLLATDPGISMVGLASTTQEAIAQCSTLLPDVVIMDVKMPGGGGAEATKVIRQRHSRTRVVAFSAYEDRVTILEMLSAGAIGYVTKGSPADELIAAVHEAGKGKTLLSSTVSAELVHELGDRLRTEEGQADDRRQRIDRIQAAISGDLRMVFQPIVDLRTGEIAGVEALARFDGVPQRTPDFWFNEATELGLGLPLEQAAFRAALTGLAELPAGMFLSVNLSPSTLVRPDLFDDLPAGAVTRLVLEVTEHAAVHDYEQLGSVLTPLRRLGARLAVDDAGAGFASLRHILLLDADFIKIDATLTKDLHRHRGRRAMASALISFAAETDATVIAEGIEQEAELDQLRRLGASYGQGFLLGRPDDLAQLDLAGPGDPRSGRGDRETPRPRALEVLLDPYVVATTPPATMREGTSP